MIVSKPSADQVLTEVQAAQRSFRGESYKSLTEKVKSVDFRLLGIKKMEEISSLQGRISSIRSQLSWGLQDYWLAFRNALGGTKYASDRAKLEQALTTLEVELSKAALLQTLKTPHDTSTLSKTSELLGKYYTNDGNRKNSEGVERDVGEFLLEAMAILPEKFRDTLSGEILGKLESSDRKFDRIASGVRDFVRRQGNTISPERREALNRCSYSYDRGLTENYFNQISMFFTSMTPGSPRVNFATSKTNEKFQRLKTQLTDLQKDPRFSCKEFRSVLDAIRSFTEHYPFEKSAFNRAADRMCYQAEGLIQSLYDRYNDTGSGHLTSVLDETEASLNSYFGGGCATLTKKIQEATDGLKPESAVNLEGLLEKIALLRSMLSKKEKTWGGGIHRNNRRSLDNALQGLEEKVFKASLLQAVKSDSEVGKLLGIYYSEEGEAKSGDKDFRNRQDFVLDILHVVPKDDRESFAEALLETEKESSVTLSVVLQKSRGWLQERGIFSSETRSAILEVCNAYDLAQSLEFIQNGLLDAKRDFKNTFPADWNGFEEKLLKLSKNERVSCKQVMSIFKEVEETLQTLALAKDPDTEFQNMVRSVGQKIESLQRSGGL